MENNSVEYGLYSAVTPVAVTSSTDVTPIVVTATTHGLVTGDLVFISGHTTNVAANGYRSVTRLTANTFSLQDPFSGASIAGSGGGAGASGVVTKSAKILNVKDYSKAVVEIVTTGTATMTLKVAGSSGNLPSGTSTTQNSNDDTPNLGGTLSATNFYNFLYLSDLDTTATNLPVLLSGATGLALSGADANKTYVIDITGVKYMALIPVSWSAGVITAKIRLFGE